MEKSKNKYNISKEDKQKILDYFLKPEKKKRKKTTRYEYEFQSQWSVAIGKYFKFKKIPFLQKKIKDLGELNWYDCFVRFKGKHVAMELKMCFPVTIKGLMSAFNLSFQKIKLVFRILKH